MDSPVGGSTSSFHTQQSQPIGISAPETKPDNSSTLQPLLSAADSGSYPREDGPDAKATADRNIHPEAGVIPRLASLEYVTAQKPLADSMQTHLQPSKTVTKKAENEGLPVENEQLLEYMAISGHEADISGSESEDKPQTLQTSQAKPLPKTNVVEHDIKSIQDASYQAVPDIVASSNDSGVSKVEQNDAASEQKPIKATEKLPLKEDDVAKMFRLTGKIPKQTDSKGDDSKPKSDHEFRYSSGSTTAGKLRGRYTLSVEHKDIPDMTAGKLLCGTEEEKPMINLGYIDFYSRKKSPFEARSNPIPISYDHDTKEYYVDIDLVSNANTDGSSHVVAYLSPIPTGTPKDKTSSDAYVSLSMERVGNLPEKKPEDSANTEPTNTPDASPEPEEITSLGNKNAEVPAMHPKKSEVDSKKERSRESTAGGCFGNLLSCCIRDRDVSHPPSKINA